MRNRSPRLLAQVVLNRAGRGGEIDVEGDGPARIDLQVVDESERDDVLVQIRVADDAQGVEDLLVAGANSHSGCEFLVVWSDLLVGF